MGSRRPISQLVQGDQAARLADLLQRLVDEVRTLSAVIRPAVERQLSAHAISGQTFSAAHRETWPEVLTADEVAKIFRRSANGLKTSCKLGHFHPPPFQVQPYRWSRADVLHHLEAGTTAPRGRARGTPRPRGIASKRRLAVKNQ